MKIIRTANYKKLQKKAVYGDFGDTINSIEEEEVRNKINPYKRPTEEHVEGLGEVSLEDPKADELGAIEGFDMGLLEEAPEEESEGYTLSDIERDMPGTIDKVVAYLTSHPDTTNLEAAQEIGISPKHVDEVAHSAGIEVKDDVNLPEGYNLDLTSGDFADIDDNY
jgi:hypothetical protein